MLVELNELLPVFDELPLICHLTENKSLAGLGPNKAAAVPGAVMTSNAEQ